MHRHTVDKKLIAHDRRKWLVLLLLLFALLGLMIAMRTPLSVAKTPFLSDPITDTNIARGETLTFEGSGIAGGAVALVANGTEVAKTTVNPAGKWAMAAPFEAVGTYAVAVNALDQAGNVFSASRAITVSVFEPTVATPTPAPTVIYLPPTVLQPNSTTAGEITLRGQAPDGESVALYVDAELVAIIPTDAEGNWDFLVNLSKGDHTIKVIALDAENNELAESIPLKLDLAPALTDIALSIDEETEAYLAGPLDFAGVSIPNATVQLLLDEVVAGETRASDSGRWGTTLTVAPGEHTLKIYAVDESGNPFAASETIAFSVLTEDGDVYETPTPVPTATPDPNAVPTVTPDVAATPTALSAPTAEVNSAAAPPTTVPIDCTQEINHGQDFGSYWRVGECDTLFYISRETGVPVLDLQAANTWVPNFDYIVPGWELTLPER